MVVNGGKATCKFLSEQLGVETAACISRGANFGRRAAKFFEIEEYKDKDGKDTPFVTCFVGRYVEDNLYEWKLRDELKEALESNMIIDARGQVKKGKEALKKYNSKVRYDKNMILYGPPGTGKTYNTAIYAVAICDEKTLSEVEAMPYDEVLVRYRELRSEGRIAFTTFHQSYGYEEFIEGIKPVLDGTTENIGYTIEDGVFKSFCKNAELPSDIEVDHNAKVWKVVLKSGDKVDQGNSVKTECFKDGKIMFNWKSHEEEVGSNNVWLIDVFRERMNIGDFVVAYAGKSTNIDAIGRVTGEAVYDAEKGSYRWSREVKWLDTSIDVDIKALNGNKYFGNDPLQDLKRVSLAEILKLVSTKETVTDDKPHVFIIDEINRGNISKIFGELITLIEDTKRKGMPEAAAATLPYSEDEFSVPNNVYILGTMNTADRSIALMDTALRRRFQFVEKMPNVNVLRKIGADKINEAGIELDVAAMLETINERIEYLFDREHTIGHAFFTGLKDEPTVVKLADIFKKSVIPLLQEYFYEDYSKIMLVLGDNGKEHDEQKFILATETKANTIFRGDTSDIDIPDFSYTIQESAFLDIMSYIEITG